MKKFWLKTLIFIAPLIILVVADLYVLPPEYFTFRTWEIVSYNKFKILRTGPFYPSIKVKKIEEGNLGHHSSYAVIKNVEWITDQYGYRNYEGKGHNTIVLGDSNIAGATLDQKDTFTEVLEEKIGGDVYSMGGANINDYLEDKRFVDDPPQRVILASIRDLPSIYKNPSSLTGAGQFIKEKDITQEIIREIDRFLKLRIIRYANSSLERSINKFFGEDTIDQIAFVSEDVLFLKLENDYNRRTEGNLAVAVSVVKSYQEYFSSKDIEFMFLPIPNKRDIYHESLLDEQKSNFVPLLTESLQAEGIHAVDIYTTFEEAHRNGEELYHIDDTHWNSYAVSLAAQLTADMINNKEE
jgi:alginate O-acetyltransferase complex protein AlgJ